MNSNIVPQVNRYPGNKYKSFRSLAEAQEWIGIPRPSAPSSRSRDKSSTGLPASSTMPLDTDDGHIPAAAGPSAPSEPPQVEAEAEKPPEPGESGVTLSPEQTRVLSMVKSGGNVFFTGSAGTFPR
jgi:hypothetical protein